MKALLDSDILGYRIAFACKDEDEKIAKYRLDSYIADILMCGVDNAYPGCFADRWQLFLTGKENFRETVATTAVYKGNRVAPKPEHLPALREHMIKEWGAVVAEGQEADDAIAIEATKLGDDCVIVSLDKDLDQVAGYHYNFVKKESYYITPEEGMLRFYMQILTGDNADNIIGLHGIGNVKARKLLNDAADEAELYHRCVLAYDGNEDRVIENARLLFLRRHEGQTWQPPLTQTMSL